MFTHICMAWFCLVTLSAQKQIGRFDRLRLWVKSLNLYVCLLGFADKARSEKQVRAAMVCALLSAVYDYETDWRPITTTTDSAFLRLLDRFVDECPAKQKASEFFLQDLGGGLSESGLERGSGAFRFYHAVIGGKWLAEYSSRDLDEFGRLLQVIDDLLDYEHDKKHNETNCFLTEHWLQYVEEARAFMFSGFFEELISHCWVYALIRWRCQHICHKLCGTSPTARQIIHAHRPLTVLYAGVAVLAGFRIVGALSLLAIFVSLVFALITGSIMLFNDIVEREHDSMKKGKDFCNEHTWPALTAFVIGFAAIGIGLLVVAYTDRLLSLFCAGVWVVGLAYSMRFVRRLYLVQAVLVAACSASPILCVAVHSRTATPAVVIVFLFLTVMVLMREHLKDIEDVETDRDWKATLPTKKGVAETLLHILLLLFVSTALLILIPTRVVRVAVYGLAVAGFFTGLSLLHPERCRYIRCSIDAALCCILLAILIAP